MGTVCSPIKAKFHSWAFTCGNIRVLTSSYYYSFVWRFQKCMNGSCSSKDTKVIRFLIFRKIGFFNFAILKSSSNPEMAILIKKSLTKTWSTSQNQPLTKILKWSEHVYFAKSWVEFTSMDQYFGFFALKLLSLHKYKFYQKNLLYSKIIQLSGTILVEKRSLKVKWHNCYLKKCKFLKNQILCSNHNFWFRISKFCFKV